MESILTLLTGTLGLSLIGGWHCAGMCGPIAALNVKKHHIYLYHLGRIITYTFLGGLCGYLGNSLYLSLHTTQKIINISTIGLAIFLFIFLVYKIQNQIVKKIWLLIQKIPSYMRHFILGILNGFLPCHFLYGFLVIAASTKSIFLGVYVLLTLWLGSFFYLISFSWIGKKLLQWKHINPIKYKIIQWSFFLAILLSLIGHYLPHP